MMLPPEQVVGALSLPNGRFCLRRVLCRPVPGTLRQIPLWVPLFVSLEADPLLLWQVIFPGFSGVDHTVLCPPLDLQTFLSPA